MKTTDICNRLQVALKHSALALTATAGLAIGTAQAVPTTKVIDLGPVGSGTAFTVAGGLYPQTTNNFFPRDPFSGRFHGA